MKRLFLSTIIASSGCFMAPLTAQPVGTISAERAAMCDDLYAGQQHDPGLPACVVTPLVFATGSNPVIVGDGTTPGSGGLAPAIVNEHLTGIPTPEPYLSAFAEVITNPAGAGCGGDDSFDPCGRPWEKKVRFNIGHSALAYDDPERNFRKPGSAHLHDVFGSCDFTAFTTYASRRRIDTTRGTGWGKDCSRAEGQNINNTAYWQPAFVTCVGGTPAPVSNPGTGQSVALNTANQGYSGCSGGGKKAAVISDNKTVYYVSGEGPNLNPLANGQQYIVGYDMDDPQSHKRTVEQANTAAGYARYRYRQGSTGTPGTLAANYWENPAAASPYTFHRYTCNGITKTQLRNPDGTDAFGGQCASGMPIQRYFVVSFIGVQCWDGTNISTPRGYMNVRPPLHDTLGDDTDVCAQGWYKQGAININESFSHEGFAPRADGKGYGAWALDSDPMAPTPAGGVGTPPGYSYHLDYAEGWHPAYRRKWEFRGLGMTVLGATHGGWELNDGAIDLDTKLPNNPISYPNSPFPAYGADNDADGKIDHPTRIILAPERTTTDITAHTGH